MIPEIQRRTATVALPAALLAGLLVFAGYGWLQEQYARLKAETQTGAQQKEIDGLRQQQANTQLTLVNRLASIENERKKPATAAQLISDTSRLLPNLPQPLQVQSVPVNAALPDGPVAQTLVIPEADFTSIRDAQLTCQENAAKLAACQTVNDEGSRQLKLTEQQRDEWKTAAKGGSIWRRAVGAAKWFAVGAATGAATYAIARHR